MNKLIKNICFFNLLVSACVLGADNNVDIAIENVQGLSTYNSKTEIVSEQRLNDYLDYKVSVKQADEKITLYRKKIEEEKLKIELNKLTKPQRVINNIPKKIATKKKKNVTSPVRVIRKPNLVGKVISKITKENHEVYMIELGSKVISNVMDNKKLTNDGSVYLININEGWANFTYLEDI